ncbi:PHP-associated domain-containing protein [Aquibacillus albus]|uniref:Histidinol phosphatase-like PHP family hydrolase n=1 Tax=Aquibacillus albus TaxID=1168171 RepID=A0ABS2MW45_9BACI|nr:PHP-associated domain-containing protein [Aquibacillus albus]MBM7570008.1 histidinol phosphatase-like PHP family hydrolase [Aquibacillus albus]
MKIDFHTHGKLTKKSEFSLEFFLDMVKEANLNGLHAFTLTEHFNTLHFVDIYHTLDEHYDYNDDYYDIDGFKVFPGLEVDIKETGHILLIGHRNDVLEISERLASHRNAENFIPFAELLSIAQQYDMIKIGAHPFRNSTPLHHLDQSLLSQLDFFDLNGKDLYNQGREIENSVRQLGDNLRLPVVGGSDSHYPLQLGSIINKLDRDCNTIQEIRTTIQNQNYQTTTSPCLETKVKAAKQIKKMLKESQGV